jgi:hypothetical protein
MNTSGFYKKDGINLLYGKNFVLNSAYELRRETKDQHTYPVDGWKWFDNEKSARTEYNIPISVTNTFIGLPDLPGITK